MTQTIARRATLPVVPRVVCPAASPVAGVTPEKAGVICRVMLVDRAKEQGLGMTPGQLAISRDGSDGVLMSGKSDPSTIQRMCCGSGVPVVNDLGGKDVESYTYCPVWQAEKLRIAEGRDQLAGGGLQAPEPVSRYDPDMPPQPGDIRRVDGPEGSTLAAEDPWAQARKDSRAFATERSERQLREMGLER